MIRKNILSLAIATVLTPTVLMTGCSSTPTEPRYSSVDDASNAPETHVFTEAVVSESSMKSPDMRETENTVAVEDSVIAEIHETETTEMEVKDSKPLEEIDETIAAIETDLEEPVAGPERPAKTIFKFGFDKKELPAEDMEIIIQHGRFLSQHPEKRIQLHGHADAQGDQLYNQYLATQRAHYVSQLLQEEGVSKEQIEIFSWGSDKPVESGSAWKDHRRVELFYDETFMVQAPYSDSEVTTAQ